MFAGCLKKLNDLIEQRTAAAQEDGEEDMYFLLEAFRTDGAPVQQVKQLRQRYFATQELPDDAAELVGMLLFTLRVDDTCIQSSNNNDDENDSEQAASGLIGLAQDALTRAEAVVLEQEQQRRRRGRRRSRDDNLHLNDELNTTQDQPDYASSSSDDEDKRKAYDNEDDDEEEDDEDEDDDQEMKVQLAAKSMLSVDDVARAISKLPQADQLRCMGFCQLLHLCAKHPSSEDDQEDDDVSNHHAFNLAIFFAPMLAKPPRTAYLSIRHAKQVPALRLLLWVWIDRFSDVSQVVTCAASSSKPAAAAAAFATAQPQAALAASSSSAASSPSTSSLSASKHFKVPPVPRLSASSLLVGTGKLTSSPLKRPSNLLSAPSPKKKLSNSEVDVLVAKSAAISAFWSPDGGRDAVLHWLDLQIGRHAEDAASCLSPPPPPPPHARRWANEQRLEIEKRVLKKRLLLWDREFERQHQRKPNKEDRLDIKGVFTAYAAVKLLLNSIKEEDADVAEAEEEERELLEKKALQAVLKLFERDFADKMKRKVEFASDIAGRELEYTRYKELKERTSSSSYA